MNCCCCGFCSSRHFWRFVFPKTTDRRYRNTRQNRILGSFLLYRAMDITGVACYWRWILTCAFIFPTTYRCACVLLRCLPRDFAYPALLDVAFPYVWFFLCQWVPSLFSLHYLICLRFTRLPFPTTFPLPVSYYPHCARTRARFAYTHAAPLHTFTHHCLPPPRRRPLPTRAARTRGTAFSRYGWFTVHTRSCPALVWWWTLTTDDRADGRAFWADICLYACAGILPRRGGGDLPVWYWCGVGWLRPSLWRLRERGIRPFFYTRSLVGLRWKTPAALRCFGFAA